MSRTVEGARKQAKDYEGIHHTHVELMGEKDIEVEMLRASVTILEQDLTSANENMRSMRGIQLCSCQYIFSPAYADFL